MRYLIFLSLFATISVAQNRIADIAMVTGNCDRCGMTFVGSVSLKVIFDYFATVFKAQISIFTFQIFTLDLWKSGLLLHPLVNWGF